MGQKAISFNSEKKILSCALKAIFSYALMALNILKTTKYYKVYYNLDKKIHIWCILNTFYSSMSDK